MRQLPVTTTPPVSPLMTPHETSQALGLSLDQLSALRSTSTGPKFYQLDADLVRYPTADIVRLRADQTASRG